MRNGSLRSIASTGSAAAFIFVEFTTASFHKRNRFSFLEAAIMSIPLRARKSWRGGEFRALCWAC